jgi:DNA polymerase-1
MSKRLLIVDAHAIIHRAFHALPDTLSTKDGVTTNAVYGFFLMIQKVLNDFNPSHIAVCFDTPKPTFRKKLFTGYQAKRPPMDDKLKPQIPLIKELLDAGGVTRIEKEGFEADDVIGTISNKLKQDFDQIFILTGDRDLLQLTDDKISLIAPKKGVSDFYFFTPDDVVKKFGIPPANIPDYKALAGDSSDNYNTAKGIGPKTAVKLLTKFDNVENLLTNLDKVDNPKWQDILKIHKDQILLFKKIATIVQDLEITPALSGLAFNGFKEGMKKNLSQLELFSLIIKLFPTKNNAVKKTETNIEAESDKQDQISLF